MKDLTPDEIDSILYELGYGFLGLAKSDTPYVIPMSFGYDGANLYFQMNSQGRKFEYIGNGTPAAFTTLDIDPEAELSRSVMVEGSLTLVSEANAQEALEALADNAVFGTDLSVWGVPLQESELQQFVMKPESMSGREFGLHME